MYSLDNKHLIFVIYDGIKNSVFKSQVLAPLLKKIEADINLEITLISFEKRSFSNKEILKIIPSHNRLHFILAYRLPFLNKLTLLPAIWQLKVF